MTPRGELIGIFRSRGLRADDAAEAADAALGWHRRHRNALIRGARTAGMSLRQIARVFGVDVAIVHRVLTAAGIKSTVASATITLRQAVSVADHTE